MRYIGKQIKGMKESREGGGGIAEKSGQLFSVLTLPTENV